MNNQEKLILIVILLILPTILLYLRSFSIAFIDAWIHRKDRDTKTIGDLAFDIKYIMSGDFIISWDLPFIIPIFSILTLAIIIVLDIGHLLSYIFGNTLYKVFKSNIFKLTYEYCVKIPIRYCVLLPWKKVKEIFECIKEKIYSINIPL